MAMRVEKSGEESSHLVLVSPKGRTRAIELDGVEGARISWTEHGITTSDAEHDYVISNAGLTEHTRKSGDKPLEASREWFRVQSGPGTLVGFSKTDSSGGGFVTYLDGDSGKATSRVSPYGATSTAAVCGERVFSPGRGTDTKAFEDDSQSVPESELDRAALTSAHPHDGTDILSTLEPASAPGVTSPCADGIVYEPWQDDEGQDFVRTWNTEKGLPSDQTAVDHAIDYPADASHSAAKALKVVDDQLVWVDDYALWSAPLPSGAAPIQARRVGQLNGEIGLDAGALAYSSNAAYTVAKDGDLHRRPLSKRGHDRAWTELTELNLLRTDLATGKPSLALEVDVKDVDFPTDDVYVTALAVNPEWAAE